MMTAPARITAAEITTGRAALTLHRVTMASPATTLTVAASIDSTVRAKATPELGCPSTSIVAERFATIATNATAPVAIANVRRSPVRNNVRIPNTAPMAAMSGTNAPISSWSAIDHTTAVTAPSRHTRTQVATGDGPRAVASARSSSSSTCSTTVVLRVQDCDSNYVILTVVLSRRSDRGPRRWRHAHGWSRLGLSRPPSATRGGDDMPVVEVSQLTKRYGERVAVDDLSFAVGEGEIFGIVGPNGAGTTTTVESIVGLGTPDSDTIRVLGLDPHRDRRQLFRRAWPEPSDIRRLHAEDGRHHDLMRAAGRGGRGGPRA